MITSELNPKQIVAELDKYVIGQSRAKRAVAIALRNRQRRWGLPEKLREEVRPKNILMIGPTGVGKTEIARRLARLVKAPFIKVEATKFTEVGYVGRDVESIIKDLVEVGVRMVREEKTTALLKRAKASAEYHLARILAGVDKKQRSGGPLALFEIFNEQTRTTQMEPDEEVRVREFQEKLTRGELEEEYVLINVPEAAPVVPAILSQSGMEEIGQGLQDFFGSMMPKKMRSRRMTIAEARESLTYQEVEKLLDYEEINKEAISRVEESGIVFLDEIDKIVGSTGYSGPDVSREGVQRDILPMVEGSTIWTKYGPVRTDHILFIAAGAFHLSKPADLIPEFQGRFPIRVELEALSVDDFERIMIEPENALIKQEIALLASEGLEVEFTPEAVRVMAEIAFRLNEEHENIGARRLYTILEQVLEDISFRAPDYEEKNVKITREFVLDRLNPILERTDVSRYIL